VARRRLVVGLGAAASVVLIVAGLIYLSVQCQHLPAFLPGREAGSTRHRWGFAAAALIAGALVGAAAAVAARGGTDPT